MSGIRMSFSGNEVLHGVDFSLRAGHVHALVGENGAGKSTLMKILAGECIPQQGRIVIDGKPGDYRSPRGAQKAGVSMIHQELSYIPSLSVAENLLLGRLPHAFAGRVRWGAVKQSAGEQLSRFGLEISPSARMDSLTVAHRQMVEIVRAVGQQARILIMDEPTSSLTAREVERLFTVVKTLRTQGVSTIYISHHLDEIFQIADEVTVLRDGVRVSTRSVQEASHGEIVKEMVGATFQAFRRRQASVSRASSVLSVEGLTLPGDFADVSFHVSQGEVYGLYGLIGGGQELVARAVAGVVAPKAGTMTVDGVRYAPRSVRQAINAGVGFVPSDRKEEGLAPSMSVQANLTLPLLADVSRLGVIAPHRERSVAARVTADVHIKAAALSQPVALLSGGNQQKVVVGRWFARRMRLLVLADPTRGVDVGAKRDIYSLIEALTTDAVGVLLVSADLPELLAVCDRVGVFRRGRLAAELDVDQVSQEDVLTIAVGGTV